MLIPLLFLIATVNGYCFQAPADNVYTVFERTEYTQQTIDQLLGADYLEKYETKCFRAEAGKQYYIQTYIKSGKYTEIVRSKVYRKENTVYLSRIN